MIIYFSLDNEGYLTGWSSTRSHGNEIKLEVEEDHEVLKNALIFKYVDGELVKDEERQQQLIAENSERENDSPATKEDVRELKDTIEELKQIILNAE